MMSNSLNKQSNFLNTKTTGAAILIVDDDSTFREALTDVLSVTVAVVYTAANGQEGLEILQQQRQSISLVLLDVNMPVMNGEQTYEKLQEIAPDVKVIISSSLSQAEAKLRFSQRELPTYLQKPYDASTLLHVVQTELAMA
jgi:CheY-like chemotaxis protein